MGCNTLTHSGVHGRGNTELVDESVENLAHGFDSRERQCFVGLVRDPNIAGTQYEGLHAERLQERAFGTEGDRFGSVPRQFFRGTYDRRLRRCFEGIEAVEQAAEFQFEILIGEQRPQTLVQFAADLFDLHARQSAQIEMQFALGAYPVRIVTTMDVSQVQCRDWHREMGVVMCLLQFAAVRNQIAEHAIHPFQGVTAQGRIAGMTGAAQYPDGLHENSLVHADRAQTGRFADYRIARPGMARRHQRPPAAHAAFFVGSREDYQWLCKVSVGVARRGLDGKREEALHIANAESVQIPVAFGQLEWVGCPPIRIEGHGIHMTGQHESAGPLAERPDDVELAGEAGEFLQFHRTTDVLQPFGDLHGRCAVAHVEGGAYAADRRGGDQRPQHGEEIGNRSSAGHRAIERDGLCDARHFADLRAAGQHGAMNQAPFRVDRATGLLAGARVLASPHCDARPAGTHIDLLVIHGISLPPGQFGGDWIPAFFQGRLPADAHPYFADIAALRVSAHLLIRRNGAVLQFVPFQKRAWHAGVSMYEGRRDCNDFSIGVELEGTDELPYDTEQYAALAGVTRALISAYPALAADRIVGHSEIAPGRKTDPGPAFDWLHYRKLIG